MIGVLRIEPHGRFDANSLVAYCKEKKYDYTKNDDGTIDIDFEKSNLNRTTLVNDLRKVARFDLGVAAMAEAKLGLLEELITLKPSFKKTVNEAISASGILVEGSIGEFRAGNKDVFVINDDNNDFVHKIARALKLPHDGNLKKIGDGIYGAFVQGESLTFYKNVEDYEADNE